MASTIQIKNSSTASNTPSSLTQGELAINVADGNLFYGDGSTVKQNFAFDEVTSSNLTVTGTASIGYLHTIYETASIIYSSGSTKFGDSLDDTHIRTGSMDITGSLNVVGNSTFSRISASGDITASNLLVYNNTTLGSSPSSITNITGSTYSTGTMELNGTMIISGADPGVSPEALQVYGDVQTYGYHRFDPVTTNIDTSISASYIYVSGSTEDLYFSQNGKGYNNVTRLRWLEGNIYTGILNGGIVSATPGGTTFNVAAGEGIVVTLNASTSSLNEGPFPTITLVKWNDFTGITPDYLTTHDSTWLTIDSSGNLVQQTSSPTNGQFDTNIQVGVVLHPNKTTISLAKTFTVTSYGIGQQTYEFIRTFGSIKVSGHAINPSGSSLYINRDPGVAFALGRNYINDPNKPSYVEEDGYNSPNLFKYYKSGSEFVTTVGTNTIDPNYYNTPDVGTGLSSVPGGQYTIKRFFYFPNSPDTVGVYYGRQTYNSISTALSNLPYEEFEELDNTLTQAIFCGYLIVKGGATNLSNASDAKFIQAGTFRNTLSGGGGATTSDLNSLSDVTIGTPLQGQVLRYNSGTSQWINSYTEISGSFTGSLKGTATTASYVQAANIDGTIDISDQTNLAGGTNLTLSGDTINLDANISLTSVTASSDITTAGSLITTKTGSVTDPALLIGVNSGYLAGNNTGIILEDLVPGTNFFVPYFVSNGAKIFGFGTVMTMEKNLDMKTNRIYFDSDSTNTYIAANTDDPEDLEIHADQDIILNPDGQVIANSNISASGTITANSFVGTVTTATTASYVAVANIDGAIDISDQTNLAGGTNLTLSDDTMNLDADISLTSVTSSVILTDTRHLPNTDGSDQYYGDVVKFGGGGVLTQGSIYYLDSSQNWQLADASAASTAQGMLGIATSTGIELLVKGIARHGGWAGLGHGSVIYLSETAGELTITKPTTSGAIVRVIGYCTNTTTREIYFNPSTDWIELA